MGTCKSEGKKNHRKNRENPQNKNQKMGLKKDEREEINLKFGYEQIQYLLQKNGRIRSINTANSAIFSGENLVGKH